MSMRAFNGIVPRLGSNVHIDASAVVIGDVELDADVSIWPMAVVRGDVHRIHVGARSSIQDGAVLHVTHDGPYTPGGAPLRIGADVTIGHATVLHACTIEDACLIGIHATILDGAVVRRHSMIGAGAMLSPGKVVGEGELWLGNPARFTRKLSDIEIEKLYYSAQNYVRLKNQYLRQSGH